MPFAIEVTDTVKKSPQELPLLFTRRQLSKVFAKDERTIARWLEDGLPCEVKGRGGRPSMYSLPACVEWVIHRELQAQGGAEDGKLSPQVERAKLDQRRREELEIKIQVRRGELVEAAAVRSEFADLAVAVRARLRAIPDAVADQLAGLTPAASKALLLARIDDALRELARGETAELQSAEPADEDEFEEAS